MNQTPEQVAGSMYRDKNGYYGEPNSFVSAIADVHTLANEVRRLRAECRALKGDLRRLNAVIDDSATA